MSAMGIAQIKGVVVQKPDPSVSEDKKRTFYVLVIAGIGFQQRFDCTAELYQQVTVDDAMLVFEGGLAPFRARPNGSDYDRDLQKITLTKLVKPATKA